MAKRKRKQQKKLSQYNKLKQLVRKFGRVRVTFLSYCSQFKMWRPSRDRIVYANGKCVVKYYSWDVDDGKPKETPHLTFGDSCFASYAGPKDLDKTIKAMKSHDSYGYKITNLKTGFRFSKEIKDETIDLTFIDRVANYGLRALR